MTNFGNVETYINYICFRKPRTIVFSQRFSSANGEENNDQYGAFELFEVVQHLASQFTMTNNRLMAILAELIIISSMQGRADWLVPKSSDVTPFPQRFVSIAKSVFAQFFAFVFNN
jgi:hypothetical protein